MTWSHGSFLPFFRLSGSQDWSSQWAAICFYLPPVDWSPPPAIGCSACLCGRPIPRDAILLPPLLWAPSIKGMGCKAAIHNIYLRVILMELNGTPFWLETHRLALSMSQEIKMLTPFQLWFSFSLFHLAYPSFCGFLFCFVSCYVFVGMLNTFYC